MPAYRGALYSGVQLKDAGLRLSVPVGGGREQAGVLTGGTGSGIPVYLVEAARYFDRHDLYGSPGGDYPDNARRFAFFARAVLELLRQIGAPHILHAHDWQAALSIAFLKAQPERYPGLSTVRTALTVHNLGYQGVFPEGEWPVLGLDRSLFTPRHFEFYGKINFLKAGLALADTITTVSPTYACEIQTPEYGFGLEGVLRERASRLTGILNGVDYGTWNPETDRWITHTYGIDDLSGKGACKADLQAQFGLPAEPGVPLIGMVTRLASQKGMDLMEAAISELMKRELQLVIGGMGDQQYQELVATWARQYPGKLAVKIAFDEKLAHQVEAGADMFLMPSRYEPSGLNQLYSLKYGTIPIVRATGGLRDSVEEFDGDGGTGFLFDAYEPSALLKAVDRAVQTYNQKERWGAAMRNAMSADFSWKRSAEAYIRVFRGETVD
jgi:starch synthase